MKNKMNPIVRSIIIVAVLTVVFIAAVSVLVLRSAVKKDSANETAPFLSILFIGNSHTYYNDLPLMVRRLAEEDGYDCSVTMIAHGGWYLRQHVEQPETRFNILNGGYDYVVLQEYAQPFVQEAEYRESANTLNAWIREAGSTPVIYETWATESAPGEQAHMNEVHRRIAEEIDALLAPVGGKWWDWQESHPDVEMFDADGEHASEAGSEFAAECIWETIRDADNND